MRRILIACLLFASAMPHARAATEATQVCIKDKCVTAEIARTEAARSKGLMYRDSIAGDSGMLFVFPDENKHSFWMLNMLFPIDIIWISSVHKIVDIRQSAAPCMGSCPSMTPRAAAAYVLEVQAGFTLRNRVEVGDTVSFTISSQ